MWTDWEKKIDPNSTIPRHLLWDVDLKQFDLEKGKTFVVGRVIERGQMEDFYTLFRMYGGVDGVREIAKKIKYFRWPRDIDFTRAIFDIKKEDMLCYERKRLRDILLYS